MTDNGMAELIDALIYLRKEHSQCHPDGCTWRTLTEEDMAELEYELGTRHGLTLVKSQQLWSTSQAAEYLGVHPRSVRKKLTRAGIPHVDTRGWPADQIQQCWPKGGEQC